MLSVFSTVVLIGDTVNKLLNIANWTWTIKNPNWREANQLAVYTTSSRSWTRDYRRAGEQIQMAVGWRIWTRDLLISNPAPKKLWVSICIDFDRFERFLLFITISAKNEGNNKRKGIGRNFFNCWSPFSFDLIALLTISLTLFWLCNCRMVPSHGNISTTTIQGYCVIRL